MRNPGGDEERRRALRAVRASDDPAAAERLERERARLGDEADSALPDWATWGTKVVFIPWDEIVSVLGLQEHLIYFDGSEIHVPNWVFDAACEQFDYWKKDRGYYEIEHDRATDGRGKRLKPLTETQAIEARALFSDAIEAQLLPWNALRRDPARQAVEIVNRFATLEGSVYNHDRELPFGLAVEIVSVTTPETNPGESHDKLGCTFKLYPPFITAYVEGAMWVGYGDERLTLANMNDGEVVFRVARWLWNSAGGGPSENHPGEYWLGRDWDPVARAIFPRDAEVEKVIAKNRPKRKRGRR